MHFAHSTSDTTEADWQPLVDHLTQVATLAAARGGKFGAAAMAALAGRFHDLGKYSQAFQSYIRGRGPSPDISPKVGASGFRI